MSRRDHVVRKPSHLCRFQRPDIYSDDSLIRTRLFSVDISGLKSFPDY